LGGGPYYFVHVKTKNNMANYVVSMFYNLWGGEQPTTAAQLSKACDQHITQKQEERARLEETKAKADAALETASSATKTTKQKWQQERDILKNTIVNMEDRFRSVRNAINITFEGHQDQDDAVESLGQLCSMVEGFSKTDFLHKVSETKVSIAKAKGEFDQAKAVEQEKRDCLNAAVVDIRTADNHIKELEEIKVQLDKRLNDKYD
jgi:hypothetical protein